MSDTLERLAMKYGYFLNLGEAAEALGVSYSTLRRMVSDGQIQTIKMPKWPKVPATAIACMVDGCKEARA